LQTLLDLFLRLFFESHTAAVVVLFADLLAIATIPSILIERRGSPSAALSWILAVVSIPYGGVFLWWMLGRRHLKRRVRKKLAALDRVLVAGTPALRGANSARIREIAPFAAQGLRWEEGVFPPVRATSANVLCEGQKAFPGIFDAVRSAKKEIRILFYIWNTDETGTRLRDLLVEKAKQGVRVYALADAVGSPDFHGRFLRPLIEAGGRAAVFLPARFRPWAPTFNFRNHRKLITIDGETAFTGGMNIGDEYLSDWRDIAVELKGSIVAVFDSIFAEDWCFATGEALASGYRGRLSDGGPLIAAIASGPDRQKNRMQDAFFLAINSAKKRIWLTTPYFIPGPVILASLAGAAQRGVDVRVTVPRFSDVPLVTLASRSYYSELLDSGVRIFEYTKKVLHSKLLTIDDDAACFGSANIDVRSFRLNFELACLVFSKRFNAAIAAVQKEDFESSEEVRNTGLAGKSYGMRLVESMAHLLSPLL